MRTLVQPGPIHPRRIDSFAGAARYIAYTVPSGQTLADGLTGPLCEAGFQAAVLRFASAEVSPFHYVMPDHPADPSHVAYFSNPRTPAGVTRIEHARATFGFRGTRPFLHCHAAWIEPDGRRRGGHILNEETVLASAVHVEAWGFDRLRIETVEDAETNFPLFQPAGETAPGGNAVLARVRPNQDITLAVEAIAHAHGLIDARIVGSVGSLIGTQFDDGRRIDDHATEVLVTEGAVAGGIASLRLISVDMAGEVQEGRLARGQNPVCITFDLVLIRAGDDDAREHRAA